jgi:hypothetical protein
MFVMSALGLKRTLRLAAAMSANDPFRISDSSGIINVLDFNVLEVVL